MPDPDALGAAGPRHKCQDQPLFQTQVPGPAPLPGTSARTSPPSRHKCQDPKKVPGNFQPYPLSDILVRDGIFCVVVTLSSAGPFRRTSQPGPTGTVSQGRLALQLQSGNCSPGIAVPEWQPRNDSPGIAVQEFLSRQSLGRTAEGQRQVRAPGDRAQRSSSRWGAEGC